MNTANLLRLILLAAIWGGSFLFMRISAPMLGPAVLIEFRVLFAALFLAASAVVLKKRLRPARALEALRHPRLLQFGLPVPAVRVRARTLPASVLAVLNATAPMWGALLGAVWSRQAIGARTALGLVLGTAGVALLVGFDHATSRPGAGLAVAAALVAAFSYSVASLYARTAKSVEPFANAHGTMWTSALMVLPALPLFPLPGAPTPGIVGAVLALGVLCSGVAYILYFRLIEAVGATSALTVTFLSPVFGILWGALFLGETVGWYTLAGSAIVLVGTALVTGFVPRFGRRARRRAAQANEPCAPLDRAAGRLPPRGRVGLPRPRRRCAGRTGRRRGASARACCWTACRRVLDVALHGRTAPSASSRPTAGRARAAAAREALVNMLGLRIDPAAFERPVARRSAVRPARRAPARPARDPVGHRVRGADAGPSSASRSTCRSRSRCAAASSSRPDARIRAACGAIRKPATWPASTSSN